MPRISPLQMTEGTGWTGYTSENHLGAIYQQSPQKASKLMTRIKAATYGDDLESFLSRFTPLYLDDERDFTWELQGNGQRNVKLVEARINGSVITAADQPGLNNTEFEVVFEDALFSPPNVIVGHKNEKYPLQILDNYTMDGTNYVYRVALMTGDTQLFMPFDELQPGMRFSKDFSSVEKELSEEGGLVNFTSPFTMRNAFTRIRMQHTTPGNMIDRKIEALVKMDGSSQIQGFWTQYADWEFEKQFQDEKNKLTMYSTSNRKADGTYANRGKSGNVLAQGAGLRQQSESANTFTYNTFSIKWLMDVLTSLSVNKLSGGEREFLMCTGEYGAIQFHEAIADYTNLFTPNLTDYMFSREKKQGVANPLGYGGQFVTYRGPNNIVVHVVTLAQYDDLGRNKISMPGKNGVAESYRYDIYDVGTSDGEPNIRKVYIKGNEDIMGYVPGLRDPFSTTGGAPKMMANAVDGYTIHRSCISGVMVKDPSRTASLIPAVLV